MQTAFGDDSVGLLTFGPLEPLVALMQETPVDRLQPILVDKLRSGTKLRTLALAGALANARTFDGQHYVGYHTLMALMPAYEMSKFLAEDRQQCEESGDSSAQPRQRWWTLTDAERLCRNVFP